MLYNLYSYFSDINYKQTKESMVELFTLSILFLSTIIQKHFAILELIIALVHERIQPETFTTVYREHVHDIISIQYETYVSIMKIGFGARYASLEWFDFITRLNRTYIWMYEVLYCASVSIIRTPWVLLVLKISTPLVGIIIIRMTISVITMIFIRFQALVPSVPEIMSERDFTHELDLTVWEHIASFVQPIDVIVLSGVSRTIREKTGNYKTEMSLKIYQKWLRHVCQERCSHSDDRIVRAVARRCDQYDIIIRDANISAFVRQEKTCPSKGRIIVVNREGDTDKITTKLDVESGPHIYIEMDKTLVEVIEDSKQKTIIEFRRNACARTTERFNSLYDSSINPGPLRSYHLYAYIVKRKHTPPRIVLNNLILFVTKDVSCHGSHKWLKKSVGWLIGRRPSDHIMRLVSTALYLKMEKIFYCDKCLKRSQSSTWWDTCINFCIGNGFLDDCLILCAIILILALLLLVHAVTSCDVRF
jgi:hypothetical protein